MLAFYKETDNHFIKASNPYKDKQAWLKNQNNLLEPIWHVGSILPSALVDIVASRGAAEDTTFEAKVNNLKKSKAKSTNGRGQGQGPKTQFF